MTYKDKMEGVCVRDWGVGGGHQELDGAPQN